MKLITTVCSSNSNSCQYHLYWKAKITHLKNGIKLDIKFVGADVFNGNELIEDLQLDADDGWEFIDQISYDNENNNLTPSTLQIDYRNKTCIVIN